MTEKPVRESRVIMTELVLPNHTNPHGHLLGGQLMLWIDICAALAAGRHAQSVCVTASVDKIDFHHPIKLGEVVTLEASVNRVFSSSLEVGVKIFSQHFTSSEQKHTNSAYLTFVNINKDGKPVPAPKVVPETEEEKRRFVDAGLRREQRLANRNK